MSQRLNTCVDWCSTCYLCLEETLPYKLTAAFESGESKLEVLLQTFQTPCSLHLKNNCQCIERSVSLPQIMLSIGP